MEADLDLARRAVEAAPADEAANIWLGRRLAYLGRFTEALDVYTKALKTHPDSYRLLRHRGHRYITVRRFDLALADLTRAWELAKNQPDAPEPDANSAPGLDGPRTTDKSNILYHLGLAHYFHGDFAKAAETFAQRTTLATRTQPLADDNLVSFLYWHYLSLRRLGRDDEAKALLAAEFRPRMNVRDNAAYHAVLRVFAGEVPAEVLAPASETGQSSNLAMAYGVGMYQLLSNRREEASAMFAKIASNEVWPSFGVIAAEAEIARSATTHVPTP
jgi:tetratricopeptide (TPR) repeat protein